MSDLLNKAKIFLGFDAEFEEETPLQQKSKSSPAVSARTNVIRFSSSRQTSGAEIRVMEPRVYEDCLAISTFLRENKPVIVSLKYIDSQNGKRLVDFVCGTAYAIGGHMLKIGENIFLYTPEAVSIVEGHDDLKADHDEDFAEAPLLRSGIAG